MGNSPIKHILRSRPQLLPRVAEPDIAYPQLRVPLARLATHGAFERGPGGVGVSEPELVPDAEDAAADAVVRLGEDGLLENGADGVVDAEAGLGPGKEGEEDGVSGEESHESLEVLPEEDGAEWTISRLSVGIYGRTKVAAYPWLA